MGVTNGALSLLENVGNHIDQACATGITNLQAPLLTLLATLAVISIATEFDMFFGPAYNFGNMIVRIMHIGFLAALIQNWGMIITAVKETGQILGMTAGGADATYTPTGLIGATCESIFKTFESICKGFPGFVSAAAGGSIMAYILALLALCVALYAIFRIAFTLFMANAEFLILGALSMVLIPFGITKWTRSIAEKCWGILLTSAVKLMVAVFMVSLIQNEITSAFNVSDTVDTKTVSTFLTSAASLVFLSFLSAQAVDMAGAMTAGGVVATNNIIHAIPKAGSDLKNYGGKLGSAIDWSYKAPGKVARVPGQVWQAGKDTINGIKGGYNTARNVAGTVGRGARTAYNATGRAAQKAMGWWQNYTR